MTLSFTEHKDFCYGLGIVFSSFMFPLKPCTALSPPSFAVGWTGELEARKVRIMGGDKNSLMETAVRQEKKE